MEYRSLGKTGVRVSRLCFGTLTMSPLQTRMPPEDGAALLCRAYERGVNFLDTADLYGTYPHIKLALKSCPDYVVSTKAYCYDEKTAREALERAFRGIGRDYVDVFMLHEQESRHTLRGHEEAIDYLEKQQRAGHIGLIGASTHFVDCARDIVRFPRLQVLHPLINMGGVGIRGGSLSDMEDAVENAHANGLFVFAMKALGGGHLIGRNRDAFRYILSKKSIDSVAVGMQTAEEVDANIAVFENHDADAALDKLSKKSRRLMIHDWCQGCGACAARCKSGALSVVDGLCRVDEDRCVLCGYCASVCPEFCIKVV